MENCKICNKTFKSVSSLVSHLTNPKSKCKIIVKDYYDKFLRKEKEGICKFCGNETVFYGISKGYQNDVCKHCRNNKNESKKIRSETFYKKREIKKIQEGYYNFPEDCQICRKRFRNKSCLSKHISQSHEISLEEYYNKFLKKDINEGICPITKEKLKFKNLEEGYFKYKGQGINSKDPEVQKKKEKTIFKNHGVFYPCFVKSKERIEKYKKTRTECKKLKETREKLINLLRKQTIDKFNKLQCQLCGRIFDNYRSITTHIQKQHSLITKDYYDKYFKKENEGVCIISNLETNFDCLERGYYKYNKLFITSSDEIKNGNNKYRLDCIHDKIKSTQNIFEVEFIDIQNIKYIGDLTKIKCLKCGNVYENRFTNLILGYGKCHHCFPKNTRQSSGEIELKEELKKILKDNEILTNQTDIIKNPKTGRSLELDIYIPNKNIAIEYNGLYWHSEINQLDPDYHLIKWAECKKKNIHLIQIFEDEWLNKKEIVLSMLKHKLKVNRNKRIFGRNCEIKEISSSEKNIFLDKNHIQGRDASTIKLGAFHNKELVSVMTFGFGNISKGGDPSKTKKWELSRFATNINYHIIGIAGKMFEYFKKKYIWEEIYTYADLRFSNGNLYDKIGFKLMSQSRPNYFYVNDFTKRIHRFNLRKTPIEPIDIPEWRLRLNQGYYRIWDCGNLKYSFKK